MESNGLYKNPQERYQDLRSSALSLLLVGGAGLAVLLLHVIGILHLPLHHFALAIMAVLFLLCLLLGVVTLKNAASTLEAAKEEDALIGEIRHWYQEEEAPKAALAALEERFTDDTEEEKELQRYETIYALLEGQFQGAPKELLDALASELAAGK